MNNERDTRLRITDGVKGTVGGVWCDLNDPGVDVVAVVLEVLRDALGKQFENLRKETVRFERMARCLEG